MTQYYYDAEERAFFAVNHETEEVRILEPIEFENDEPTLKPVKVRPAPKSEKKADGCPECGSPSRHKANVSPITVSFKISEQPT